MATPRAHPQHNHRDRDCQPLKNFKPNRSLSFFKAYWHLHTFDGDVCNHERNTPWRFSTAGFHFVTKPPTMRNYPAIAFFLFVMGSLWAGANPNIHIRGGLPNAAKVFNQTERGHVAFIGGSITQMNGYRPMVVASLKKRFPSTKFTITSAGLSSTCSTSGAFRLREQVLNQGPADLIYVEFAVNDDQDAAHDRTAAIRGFEGIIRHIRTHNPKADIVATYFVNPNLMDHYRKGSVATSIAAHEEVTRHYDIPVINLAREIQQQLDAGNMTWQQFGGVHPAPLGNRHCANMHEELMDHVWKNTEGTTKDHPVPEALDKHCYDDGSWIAPDHATFEDGWHVTVPNWSEIKGSFRKDYAKRPFLVTETPEAISKLKFEGNAIGAFVLAGPDAGRLSYRIDHSDWSTVDLYHRFSRGLHYPRTVMFGSGLPDGKHTLELKLLPPAKGSKRPANAARIMTFAVN